MCAGKYRVQVLSVFYRTICHVKQSSLVHVYHYEDVYKYSNQYKMFTSYKNHNLSLNQTSIQEENVQKSRQAHTH